MELYTKYILCPTEVPALLMCSVCKKNALLAGSGCRGEENARGARAVDLSKGPERMGIRHHEQGIAFPIKNIFLLSKYVPA
jgi:hypothetical protein